ncbi:MAG: SusC/RagA family TonB-linked outer membrane protein [Nonlabens sp.]|uniref:SusC/RagA family TonB-linked outer membrane protein n=1 Tax=Nonlabens sp. TaxID=1888209 RepID=UPI003EF2FC74
MKKLLYILLLLIPALTWAQGTITGTVFDEENEPLLGASISLEGSTTGVVSDLDGRFTLNVESFPATIVVSYLGYTPKSIPVTQTTDVVVTLVPTAESLNQIVVIGYGEVQKGELTGAVGSVKPPQNAVNVNNSVEDLIQGRVAGVQVISTGNEPGAPVSIKIRGLNSLTGNTEPLYVIDGIIVDSATEDTLDPLSGGSSYLAPQGGIAGINPRDIESIEILKDASATAIYGSRGSNGVILITTKKGEAGEARFSYDMTTTVGQITRDIDVLNANQYANYINDVQDAQGFQQSYYTYPDGSIAQFDTDEQFMIDNADTIERLDPINWSDDIYRTTVTTNHRISARGGSETSKYFIAAGYINNEGLIPNAYARSTDFVANLSNELNSKLSLDTKFAATFSKNSASKGTDNLAGTNNNIIRQIVNGVPFQNFEDNNEGLDNADALDGPRAWLKEYDDLSDDFRVLGAAKLDYEISDMFTWRTRVGVDYRYKQRKIWYGTGLFRGNQANGEAGISDLKRFRYNIDNTLMFKKKFNRDHKLNGTAGFVIDQSQIQRTSNQASNFANEDLRADGISFGQVINPTFYDKQRETILSFLGRVNYTFKNKYLFTATYRADGSSKFAEGNRFGHFPSLALAWKMDREKWLKNVESLSNLKFRTSWGITGNQAIPNYRYLAPYGATASPYSDADGGAAIGLIPTNLANPDIVWEETRQFNVGVDFGFLNERITGSVDVFKKDISNLLLNLEIAPSTGFSNFVTNNGGLENKGIEFALSADIIDTEDWKWNVYGNIAHVRNKITDLGRPNGTFGTENAPGYLGRQISGGNFFKAPANIFLEGRQAALFYGFATDGIISDADELANAPSFRGQAAQLGDVALVDQNGDGDITDEDYTIIGNPNPDFTYGFGSSVSYKQVSLSMFFNGVQGNEIANGNLLREAYADTRSSNIRTEAYNNAWSVDNPDGSYPRIGYDLAPDTGLTDRIIEDGSFLRLSYVTLGWDVPTDKFKFIDGAYLSVSGQNLLLFTKYSGFDPEVNSFASDPGRVGLDWQSFPNQRSYSVSLNITF